MRRLVLVLILFLSSAYVAQAQNDVNLTREYVPQNLLGLVHAPEVHQELGLSTQQIAQLEGLFVAIDGDWFRARIQKPEEQYATIAKLEDRVRTWFAQNTTPDQQKRLEQLELQSLGIRLLLRSEVASQIGLDASQQTQLVALAKKVNSAAAALQQATMKNEVTDVLKEAVTKSATAEQEALKTVVRPEQLQKLSSLVGKTFNTMQLSRIYPMAPELVSVEHWINSEPLSLKKLRGKVVLVHFYAFQCHNCHANFDHYRKWHQEFPDDVVVLGIQTPETPTERDPAAVKAAAKDRNMEYPVLIDLESKNWASWGNTMWPTVYVVDKNGYLRHWWQGELNWQGATGDQVIHDLITKLIQEDR